MKIVYIIGNGFDLNQQMPTRYVDFYNYYNSITSPNTLIEELKRNIGSNYETWADLEIGLGAYTNKLKTTEEFDIVYENLSEELGNYLKKQEEIIIKKKGDSKKIQQHLSKPESFLPTALGDLLIQYKDDWMNSPWTTDIITLNYTKTIEHILNLPSYNSQIGVHHKNVPITLKSVEHLHGYTDDRMILGVNDVTQLSNTEFHSNQDIIEALVKPSSNKASYDIVDEKCKNIIAQANLIYIYGCSIGETDKLWWNLIATNLRKDCRLVIFSRAENINKRHKYKQNRPARAIKELFIQRAGINKDFLNELDPAKITVAVNSSIFSDLINP